MHVVWGTFAKQESLDNCLALAENALLAQLYDVLKAPDKTDYLVVGGNKDVTLTIVCVPRPSDVWIVVTASSPEEAVATKARDVTCEMIETTPVK